MAKKFWNRVWFKVLVVLIPIVLYLFVDPVQIAVKRSISILSMVDVDAAKGYILSFGIWAPIISFLLIVFNRSWHLPATIIYSYVGGMLTGGAKTMVTGLLVLFALTIVIFVFKQIWQQRSNAKEGISDFIKCQMLDFTPIPQ